MGDRTALYELYDAAGVLLYVGISGQPRVRFAQHAQEKAWWPKVATREITWHPTRAEALAAEAAAIRAKLPLHNKARPVEGAGWSGAGRPKWRPTAEQAAALDELERLFNLRQERRRVYRANLAACVDAGIPIARLAREIGIQRKTVYRHLGRSMT